MRLVHFASSPVHKIDSVSQRERLGPKPKGFWVSDQDAEVNWKTWCHKEEFRLDNFVYAHDITLTEKAKILRLSSAEEIDVFTRKYSEREDNFISNLHIHWEEVAENFQGIIITPYIWERRLDGGADWYYGWDCASGCIWDANAIAYIKISQLELVEVDK